MVKAAHYFFITICAASGSGGMEVKMKIINDDTKMELDSISLYLTKSEAQQLIVDLKQLLENYGKIPYDHTHLNNEDYSKEIIILLYD